MCNYCILPIIRFAAYHWTFRRVHIFADRLLSSLSRSICLYSRSAGRIFMKFDICEFYKELANRFNLYLDRTILMTTLLEDLHAFLRVSQA
jgi:hypothetical protein